MPTALSATDIWNRFNALVVGPANAAAPGVTVHSGAYPAVPASVISRVNLDLGGLGGPALGVGRIPAITGESVINNVFYVMHHMAMELTRHRYVRNFYTISNGTVVEGPLERGAIKDGLELYFPVPGGIPAFGAVVTQAQVDAFCNALRTAVLIRRTDPYYAHPLVSS